MPLAAFHTVEFTGVNGPMAAQAVKALVVMAVILLYSPQFRAWISGLFARKEARS